MTKSYLDWLLNMPWGKTTSDDYDIKEAQRIIDEEPVANEDKILSLYESAVRVVVRHKAGAEVEFGNTLLLGESRQGLIMHWELFAESAPADARLVRSALQQTEQNLQIKIKEAGADRGFDSASNFVACRRVACGRIQDGPKSGGRNRRPSRNRIWRECRFSRE